LRRGRRTRGRCDVTIVCGPVSWPLPGVKRIDVESAADMLNAVMKNIESTFYCHRRGGDYRRRIPSNARSRRRPSRWTCKWSAPSTFLATVAARAQRPFVVGFAAETDSVEQYAGKKTPQEESRHDRRE